MKVSEIYKNKKQPVSFEIFPPKGDLSIKELSGILSKMQSLSPDFISVTYSAGGSGNSEKTATVASIVKNTYSIDAVAHLTCINSDKDEIERMTEKLKNEGIENILALRGDKTENQKSEFAHASDLIPILKEKGFCVGSACYPEGHISCSSPEKDREYMKLKQDLGADFFVSQLFFDNNCFYRFLENTSKLGINKPVIPGIMPFLSQAQISRMIFMCGASLPSEIIRLLNKYSDSAEDLRKAGIEYAGEQILDLLKHDVDGIHIYTMNHPDIAEHQMSLIRSFGK